MAVAVVLWERCTVRASARARCASEAGRVPRRAGVRRGGRRAGHRGRGCRCVRLPRRDRPSTALRALRADDCARRHQAPRVSTGESRGAASLGGARGWRAEDWAGRSGPFRVLGSTVAAGGAVPLDGLLRELCPVLPRDGLHQVRLMASPQGRDPWRESFFPLPVYFHAPLGSYDLDICPPRWAVALDALGPRLGRVAVSLDREMIVSLRQACGLAA